jgi:cytochrome c oxidase subunit 1
MSDTQAPGYIVPEQEETNYLHAQPGLMSWLMSIDHKRIGIMYLIAVFLTFALGGFLALAVRLELIAPGETIMTAETYNRVFTLHGLVMVFLFIIPGIPAALGNFVLPLMLGAKDVAFPRLNRASFHIYVVGTVMALYTTLEGGVDTGWTFYTPYSSTTSTPVVLL